MLLHSHAGAWRVYGWRRDETTNQRPPDRIGGSGVTLSEARRKCPLRPAIVFATVSMLVSVSAPFAEEDAPGALKGDGAWRWRTHMCRPQCHAIGTKRGQPQLRTVPPRLSVTSDRRIDLDGFTAQFREGRRSAATRHADVSAFQPRGRPRFDGVPTRHIKSSVPLLLIGSVVGSGSCSHRS